MNTKYNPFFDHNEFRYALNALSTNPMLAVARFKEYLRKYPRDYSAYGYYVTALVYIKKLDEAEETLNSLINMTSIDSKYQSERKYEESFKKNVFFAKIKLFLYQERFQEAYDLYINNPELHFKKGDFIPILCRKKLGILTEEDLKLSTYFYSQIVEYSYSRFLDHIKRHTYDNNSKLANKNDVIFTQDFPLQRVLEELEKLLDCSSNNCVYCGYYNDLHYFRFSACGTVANENSGHKVVNNFIVKTFHNSKEMITIYPCEELVIPYVDLSYLMEEDKTKVKTLSQIEKFNRRYKRSN